MKNTKTKYLLTCFFSGFIIGYITNVAISPNTFQTHTNPPLQNQSSSTIGVSSTIEVLFTPGDPCTQRIVEHINSAKKEILVQAYSFTSAPIINTLIKKHQQGVKVIVILDKSQEKTVYTRKIKNTGIPVYIDRLPGIAHNKVIIIDQKKVFTGSFNFSQAAQTRNAENSLLITEKQIVTKFLNNFYKRLRVSFRRY